MLIPVHDIPGRLRFRLDPLRGDSRKAAMLCARVRAIEGVRSASVNPLTGSLIVCHDGSAEVRRNILAALDAIGPRPAAASRTAGVEATLADILAGAIADRIIERVLRAAVTAVV